MTTHPCPRCLELPARGHWSFEYQVPREYHELVPGDGCSSCPSCGMTYRRHYEEEWDIVTRAELWTLQRLSPTEAARTLEGAAGERSRAELSTWLERAVTWLDHDDPRARRLGAWILAREALEAGDPGPLVDLLGHPDPDVTASALDAHRDAAREDAPLDLTGSALESLLTHPEVATRRLAAETLTRQARAGAEGSLETLAASGDPVVLQAMAHELRRRAACGDTLEDTVPLLRGLLEHADAEVRRAAASALEEAPQSRSALEARRSQAAAALSSDDPEVWKDGARLVGALAQDGQDVAELVPALRPGILDPARSYRAQAALAASIRGGADVSELLPDFFQHLTSRERGRQGAGESVLRALEERRLPVEEHLPAILSALDHPANNLPSAALRLVDGLVARGADLAPYQETVLAHLEGTSGYQAEEIARHLGRALLARGDLAPVAELLAHENEAFRGGIQDGVIEWILPSAAYPARNALRKEIEARGAGELESFLRDRGPRDSGEGDGSPRT